jgi:hypothetical protein
MFLLYCFPFTNYTCTIFRYVFTINRIIGEKIDTIVGNIAINGSQVAICVNTLFSYMTWQKIGSHSNMFLLQRFRYLFLCMSYIALSFCSKLSRPFSFTAVKSVLFYVLVNSSSRNCYKSFFKSLKHTFVTMVIQGGNKTILYYCNSEY